VPTIELIVLTKSKKLGGKCIAGLRTDGGGWVRPVAPSEDGTLFREHYTLNNGSEAQALDVVRIPFEHPRPEIHQPENWLIGKKPWRLVERPASATSQRVLWSRVESGPTLLGNQSDRISVRTLDNTPAQASLTLVIPNQIEWIITQNIRGRRQTRAAFSLRRVSYDLVITDPEWENYLSGFSPGSYSPREVGIERDKKALLTISLGEPFHCDCYKLVASVLWI
jgi:hypothetical protein